ncbi:unnamed protein product, partial [Ilex paraguariensis]
QEQDNNEEYRLQEQKELLVYSRRQKDKTISNPSLCQMASFGSVNHPLEFEYDIPIALRKGVKLVLNT